LKLLNWKCGTKVAPIRPVEPITIEKLIAETTKYCRYSGRLTWILIDWFIRNVDIIDAEKLVEQTIENGDITVLGLVTDLERNLLLPGIKK
jgi:hypothetical protein